MQSIPNGANQWYECAGRGCTNEGIYLLKIKFINKVGWFCIDCRNTLLNENLVDQVIHPTD